MLTTSLVWTYLLVHASSTTLVGGINSTIAGGHFIACQWANPKGPGIGPECRALLPGTARAKLFGAFKATGSQHCAVPYISLGSYALCPLFGPFWGFLIAPAGRWAMLCPLPAYLLVITQYAIMIAAGVINRESPGVWASRYSRDSWLINTLPNYFGFIGDNVSTFINAPRVHR